jgi:hypothetical protein
MIGQKLEEERLLVGKNSCTNKTEEDFNELIMTMIGRKLEEGSLLVGQELVSE